MVLYIAQCECGCEEVAALYCTIVDGSFASLVSAGSPPSRSAVMAKVDPDSQATSSIGLLDQALAEIACQLGRHNLGTVQSSTQQSKRWCNALRRYKWYDQ